MEYRVDLKGISSREELHERLAEALDLPPWYGKNLDALHDMMDAMEGRIVITGYDDAIKTLPRYAQGLRMVCLDATAENPDLTIEFSEEEPAAAEEESAVAEKEPAAAEDPEEDLLAGTYSDEDPDM